jgi:citrate lyase subunit beta/citryl-CoA lyase
VIVNVLRSLLFVPGNKSNMLEKSLGCPADALIPDMEDSVPNAEKANARDTIRAHLPKLADASPLVIPRINSLDTGWAEADLAAVVGPHIHGICVGKVHGPEDIGKVSKLMGKLENEAGLEEGSVKLIAWIESAKGIMRCYDICRASRRLIGVAFGAEDFTHDMGVERLEDDAQLAFPRAKLCIAARAADILAFDTPYFRFKDEEGLRKDSRAARHAGFKGKFAIHPAQIAAINESFSPSAEDVAHARRVVQAFEEAEKQGRGSTSLDGAVIDVPVVKRARAVLELAERIASRN